MTEFRVLVQECKTMLICFTPSHINVSFNICTDVPSAESEIGNR